MGEEAEFSEVPCTLWLEKGDGKFLGCLVKSYGLLQEAGLKLVKHYSTYEKAKALVEKRVIWKVEDELSRCVEEPGEFWPECGETLMRMQIEEAGGYAYTFSGGCWWAGKQRVEDLLEFVMR